MPGSARLTPVHDLAATTEEAIARRVAAPFVRLVLWSLRARGDPDAGRLGAWVETFRALTQLLTLKFGALDAATEARLAAAPAEALEAWAVRVLTAERLADVFA